MIDVSEEVCVWLSKERCARFNSGELFSRTEMAEFYVICLYDTGEQERVLFVAERKQIQETFEREGWQGLVDAIAEHSSDESRTTSGAIIDWLALNDQMNRDGWIRDYYPLRAATWHWYDPGQVEYDNHKGKRRKKYVGPISIHLLDAFARACRDATGIVETIRALLSEEIMKKVKGSKLTFDTARLVGVCGNLCVAPKGQADGVDKGEIESEYIAFENIEWLDMPSDIDFGLPLPSAVEMNLAVHSHQEIDSQLVQFLVSYVSHAYGGVILSCEFSGGPCDGQSYRSPLLTAGLDVTFR
jgi:hypothetical protein